MKWRFGHGQRQILVIKLPGLLSMSDKKWLVFQGLSVSPSPGSAD